MKIIKLTESQFNRLFEGIESLKGDEQSDVIEYPGPSQGMSMVTAPVTNANGDAEFGKPMNTGSDKIAKKLTKQTPFNSRKCNY